MKTLTLGLSAVIGIINAAAQPVEPVAYHYETVEFSRFYLKVDGGLSLVQDVEIKRLNGMRLPGSFGVFDEASFFESGFDLFGIDVTGNGLGIYTFNRPKISWDPGFRVDVAPGYSIDENLSVELETGFIYNQADEVRFRGSFLHDPDLNPEGTDATFRGTFDSSDLTLYQIPILANIVYRIPLDSFVRPFIGGGLGGVVTILDWNSDCDTDFTFAYQAMAGVDFELHPNLILDLSYKFLGSLDHRFEINESRIRTGAILTHAILASVTFKF